MARTSEAKFGCGTKGTGELGVQGQGPGLGVGVRAGFGGRGRGSSSGPGSGVSDCRAMLEVSWALSGGCPARPLCPLGTGVPAGAHVAVSPCGEPGDLAVRPRCFGARPRPLHLQTPVAVAGRSVPCAPWPGRGVGGVLKRAFHTAASPHPAPPGPAPAGPLLLAQPPAASVTRPIILTQSTGPERHRGFKFRTGHRVAALGNLGLVPTLASILRGSDRPPPSRAHVTVAKARPAGTSEHSVPFARPFRGGRDWLSGRGLRCGTRHELWMALRPSVMQMSPSRTFFWLLKGKKSQP